MKKFFAILLTLVMVLSLAACAAPAEEAAPAEVEEGLHPLVGPGVATAAGAADGIVHHVDLIADRVLDGRFQRILGQRAGGVVGDVVGIDRGAGSDARHRHAGRQRRGRRCGRVAEGVAGGGAGRMHAVAAHVGVEQGAGALGAVVGHAVAREQLGIGRAEAAGRVIGE